MTKLDLGSVWMLGWIGIYRDIWLDMDRQVMDGQIRFEDQSIVWIMGSSLSFKRAPHIMVKKRKQQKKYTNSLSLTQACPFLFIHAHLLLHGLTTRPQVGT
jgi:hypothetical protein